MYDSSLNQQSEKLNVMDEVEKILMEFDCGDINDVCLHDLSKIPKWKLMDIIGNYLDPLGEVVPDWRDIKRVSTFCRRFQFSENRIAEWYARSISDGGECVGYEIGDDIVLVIS